MNEQRSLEKYDYIFKIVIIGNGSCGKSSILHFYINNKAKKNMSQTVGVEFASKMITVENKIIKLQLWDTAGQERYKSVARTYYRGAVGCLVIFDLTNVESFNCVNQWIKDARDFARPDINIVSIGNKCDLVDLRRINQAENTFNQLGLDYYETSAITGENIEEAFIGLATIILRRIENGLIDKDDLKPRLMNPANKSSRLNNNNIDEKEQQQNKQCNYC